MNAQRGVLVPRGLPAAVDDSRHQYLDGHPAERMAGAMRRAAVEWSGGERPARVSGTFQRNAAIGRYNSSNPPRSAPSPHSAGRRCGFTDGATEYSPRRHRLHHRFRGRSAVYRRHGTQPVVHRRVPVRPGAGKRPSAATEAGSSGSGTAKFYLYWITARASGGSPNTIRVAESTFVTPNLVACTLT